MALLLGCSFTGFILASVYSFALSDDRLNSLLGLVDPTNDPKKILVDHQITTLFDEEKKTMAYKNTKDHICYIEKIKEMESNHSKVKTLFVSELRMSKKKMEHLIGNQIMTFCNATQIKFLRTDLPYRTELGLNADLSNLESTKFSQDHLIRRSWTPQTNRSSSNKLEMNSAKGAENKSFVSRDIPEVIKPSISNMRNRQRRDIRTERKSKYRGQVQTQFISIGMGGTEGTNAGTAEAIAQPEMSRATVSGSQGMGQAQSQSSSGDDCEHCESPSEKRNRFYGPQSSFEGAQTNTDLEKAYKTNFDRAKIAGQPKESQLPGPKDQGISGYGAEFGNKEQGPSSGTEIGGSRIPTGSGLFPGQSFMPGNQVIGPGQSVGIPTSSGQFPGQSGIGGGQVAGPVQSGSSINRGDIPGHIISSSDQATLPKEGGIFDSQRGVSGQGSFPGNGIITPGQFGIPGIQGTIPIQGGVPSTQGAVPGQAGYPVGQQIIPGVSPNVQGIVSGGRGPERVPVGSYPDQGNIFSNDRTVSGQGTLIAPGRDSSQSIPGQGSIPGSPGFIPGSEIVTDNQRVLSIPGSIPSSQGTTPSSGGVSSSWGGIPGSKSVPDRHGFIPGQGTFIDGQSIIPEKGGMPGGQVIFPGQNGISRGQGVPAGQGGISGGQNYIPAPGTITDNQRIMPEQGSIIGGPGTVFGQEGALGGQKIPSGEGGILGHPGVVPGSLTFPVKTGLIGGQGFIPGQSPVTDNQRLIPDQGISSGQGIFPGQTSFHSTQRITPGEGSFSGSGIPPVPGSFIEGQAGLPGQTGIFSGLAGQGKVPNFHEVRPEQSGSFGGQGRYPIGEGSSAGQNQYPLSGYVPSGYSGLIPPHIVHTGSLGFYNSINNIVNTNTRDEQVPKTSHGIGVNQIYPSTGQPSGNYPVKSLKSIPGQPDGPYSPSQFPNTYGNYPFNTKTGEFSGQTVPSNIPEQFLRNGSQVLGYIPGSATYIPGPGGYISKQPGAPLIPGQEQYSPRRTAHPSSQLGPSPTQSGYLPETMSCTSGQACYTPGQTSNAPGHIGSDITGQRHISSGSVVSGQPTVREQSSYGPGHSGFIPGQTAYGPSQTGFTPGQEGSGGFYPGQTAPFSGSAGPVDSSLGRPSLIPGIDSSIPGRGDSAAGINRHTVPVIGQSGHTPGSVYIPGQTGIKMDQPSTYPITPNNIPGYSSEKTNLTPGQQIYLPGQSGYTPEHTEYASGQPGYISGQPGYTSGQPEFAPGYTGYASGQPEYTPGQLGHTPGQTVYALDHPKSAPKQPGVVSLQPGHTSVPSGVIPGQPSYSTVQPGIIPGQPGIIPGQPGFTSGQPGYTPWQQSGSPSHTPGQSSYAPAFQGYPSGQPGYTQGQQSYRPGSVSNVSSQPSYATGVSDFTPGQPDYGPRQPGYTPVQSSYTPGQVGYGSGQPGQAPVQTSYSPGQSGYTPGQSGYTPGQPGYSPGLPGYTKEQPGYIQGQPGYAPGRSDYAPGQPGYTPGQPGYTPGQPAYSPGQPAYAPGQPGYTPGQPSYTPGQPSYTSGQPSSTPGQPSFTPGQPSSTPGQPSYTPGQSSYTPGEPSSTPGQASYTPGQPGYGQPEYSSGLPNVVSGQPSNVPGQSGYPSRAPSVGTVVDTGGSQIPGNLPGIPGTVSQSYPSGSVPGAPDSSAPSPDSRIAERDENITGDAQAETSVFVEGNNTKALASSQGKVGSEIAQAQVSGSYAGTGAFSAQAQTGDDLKKANSQITGGANGTTSLAQGTAGKGQTQSQVSVNGETGSTLAETQSTGFNYGTNTQVQAGITGGMADAQAKGQGITSSQAQIGFSPYQNISRSNSQNVPFRGGGAASSQTNKHSGQSQTQIEGSFKFGISYTGAAQAGTGAAVNNLKPIPLNTSYILPGPTAETPSDLTGLPSNIDSVETKLNKTSSIESNHLTPNATPSDSEAAARTEKPQIPKPELHTPSIPTKAKLARSKSTTKSPIISVVDDDYDNDKEEVYDEEIDDVDNNLTEETDFRLLKRGPTKTEPFNPNDLSKSNNASAENIDSKNSLSQTQNVVLSLDQNLLDTHIIQASDNGTYNSAVNSANSTSEIIDGYQGVASTAGTKTLATAVPGSQAQSQTVVLSSSTDDNSILNIDEPKKVYDRDSYVQPRYFSRYSTNKQNSSNNHKNNLPPGTILAVTKSETGQLSSKLNSDNTNKIAQTTYYTKTSTCGYFIFTCTIMNKLKGETKICTPKHVINNNGAPCK